MTMDETNKRRGAMSVAGNLLLLGGAMASCSGQATIDGTGTGTAHGAGCTERVLPVACRAEPPVCPADQFPASDGTCWTGECLDCIDGCQRDSDCVVVRACGCSYHEGCAWAETTYRAALLEPCIVSGGATCTSQCSAAVCGSLDCPWCDADDAECTSGSCASVVNHTCH
jgi:hypothetical protein